MALGYASAKDGRYLYPNAEAEFTLYNFHSQRQVDEMRDLFLSNDARSPRVIELFGEALSGRRYIVRAAAYAAAQFGGQTIGVETLSLEGYEPDTRLAHFLDVLAKRDSGTANQKLSELAKRVKFEVKWTPFTLLFASLAVKWEVSVDEMLRLVEPSVRSGTPMPERVRFSEFIARVNPGRLVLQIPDAQIADVAVILRLIDEAEVNPAFFLVLHYPAGKAGAPASQREHFHLTTAAWSRGEMQRAFDERFHVKPGTVRSRCEPVAVVCAYVRAGTVPGFRGSDGWAGGRSGSGRYGELVESTGGRRDGASAW